MEDTDLGQITAAAEILGSPTYMSPEQIEGKDLDGRADIYALGVVTFHMLTGSPPFEADTLQGTLMAHLTEDPPSLKERFHHPRVGFVERVLNKAMARKPADRYESVDAFIAALSRAGGRVTTEEMDFIPCGVCHASVSPASRYCGECGSAVLLSNCMACGAARQGERHNCLSCGASLLPGVRMGAVAGVDDSDAGDLAPATAVVFVARAGRVVLPPAAAREFHEIFTATIRREGGHALALLGMEGIAVFGLGGLREHEVQQAVDAALVLEGAFAAAWGGSAGDAIRIGLEVGPLMTRGTGVAWGTALATGEAVEAARTAAQGARIGGVYLGEAAWREVRDIYETQQMDEFRRVSGRRRTPQGLGSFLVQGRRIDLVGREFELGHLERSFAQLERSGQLLAAPVIGPSGVGKSRLLDEFLRRLSERGGAHSVDIGRCMASDSAPAGDPFGAMFRAETGIVPGASEDVVAQLVQLPGLSNQTEEIARDRALRIARLLGLIEESAGEGMGAEGARSVGSGGPDGEHKRHDISVNAGEQELAFEALSAHVAARAEDGPLVLVIDDLHAAGPTTLKLLAYLAQACLDSPILLAMGIRTRGAERALEALRLPPTRVVAVHVPELQRGETGALLDGLLGEGVVPDGLAQTIHELSNGIPAQIEGHVEALIAQGAFLRTTEGWVAGDDLEEDASLPISMSEVVVNRVGRLAPAERKLLTTAAVAGEAFSLEMIAAVEGRDVADEEIDVLVSDGWLMESRSDTFGTSRELAFRQEQVREILLEVLAPRMAKTLHRKTADWLVSQTDLRVPGLKARLASHYREAGEKALSARFTLDKAREAVSAYANEEAFETYGQALVMATTISDAEGSGETRELLLEAALGRADLGLLLGEYDSASDALAIVEEMAKVADVGSALPRALALRGDVEMALGQYDAARVAFEAAHGAAETAGALGVSVYAQARLARALLSAGRSEDANSLAAELFGDWKERADEDREILRALGSVTGILGHVAASRSEFQEASEHYEISREYRRRAGDGIGASMATLGIGNCALFLSEFDAAAQSYREAITEAQQIGYRRGIAIGKTNAGDALIQRGSMAEALDELRHAEEIFRRLGARDMLAETLRLLALALAAEDDLRAAEEAAEESLSLAEEFGQAPVAAGATKALEDIRQQRAKLKS